MGGLHFCHFMLIWWSIELHVKADDLREFLTTFDSVKSYKIVYPKIGISYHNTRGKRSTTSEVMPLRITIEDWTLETSLNEHLIIAPGFAVRRIFLSPGKRHRRDTDDENPTGSCEFRNGFVRGQSESFAAITVCGGSSIYGFVRVTEGTFFIQPLNEGRHIIYQSERNLTENSENRSYSFDTVMQETKDSLKAQKDLGTAENRFEQFLDYVDDYVGKDNLNISSTNGISLTASGLPIDMVWAGRESQYKGNDNFHRNFQSRVSNWKRDSSGARERVKRNLMVCNTREFYNLTGDTIDVEPNPSGVLEKEEIETEDAELPVEEDFEHIGYFFDRAWERNKLPRRRPAAKEPQPRWLEIGIAADYSVVEFHGSRVQQYILALFNIVSAIYKDPSLGSNLKLVIVRMILYADKNDGMVRRGNARKSLENVNRWNNKFLSSSNETHDIAVWLTRLDLGGPSGYAPVSGVCDPSRSCALNRDEGLTSAFIIAHELAHVLGLTHDGDDTVGNSCGEEASMGSVMAPMVAATFHRFHWSSCSKREFHQRSKYWKCLLNQPDNQNATHLKSTVHATFTMDEQCRMEFGDGYSLCRSFELPERCSHLWCGHENSSQICKTKKGPPLEGTECGEDKWCINGYCELVDRRKFGLGPVIHNVRDGGWSDWSTWSNCSRSCGVGVQFRSRKCNDPTPAYGGANCNGENEEFKICQVSECPDRTDLRAQQCARLVTLMGFPSSSSWYNLSWLPHESEDGNSKCQLTCRSRQTGEIFLSGENLIDGTPCSYGSSDICVQGKCEKIGCDNVIGSQKITDNCGECGGENVNCKDITSRYEKKLRRGMTRLAVIPQSAHHVKIELTLDHLSDAHRNDTVITIRDRRRRRNDIGKFDSWGRAEIVIVEGAAFRSQKFGDTYTLWSRGVLFSEVVVSLGVPDEAVRQGVSISVFFQYTIHRNDSNSTTRYSWIHGGWGPCSASCGGGNRQKTIACSDNLTGDIVPKRNCPLASKPPQETEVCNLLSCQFKWIRGQWEECTATCGSTGFQHREIYCVHVSVNVTVVSDENAAIIYRAMLPPDRCGPPPHTEQECNRIPCQGRWLFTDWSPCSQSCGRGIQTRLAHCGPGESTDSFFTCGKVAPYEFRSCKTFQDQDTVCSESCKLDRSKYCSFTLFQRYCEVPSFKKRCCLSCGNI